MRPALVLRVLPALLVTACASGPTTEEPVSLADWREERIELPPGFAPSLPPGEELLLFAPGMFEAGAEDFWSYVFLMRVERSELGEDDIREIIEAYYDGLIHAVAAGKDVDLDPDAANVTVLAGSGDTRLRVETTDAFVTLEPLTLNVRVESERGPQGTTLLKVMASPQPDTHAVWRSLRAAVDSISL